LTRNSLFLPIEPNVKVVGATKNYLVKITINNLKWWKLDVIKPTHIHSKITCSSKVMKHLRLVNPSRLLGLKLPLTVNESNPSVVKATIVLGPTSLYC
jgi:hypothetical protein